LISFFITIAFYRYRLGGGSRLTNAVPKEHTDTTNSLIEYSKTLVIGHRQRENISWTNSLPPSITRSIYLIDAPPGNSTLPANKGREAMVYLTYIIDHYPTFPDIVLFFHPSDIAWHNNILLDYSSRQTITHLNEARVLRDGYFNSRCHRQPGCPDWLHFDVPMEPLPNLTEWRYAHKGLRLSKLLGEKPEERYLTSSIWHELHPGIPVPRALSQNAGAQFAVSGARIALRPKSDYVRWRGWLLKTELPDKYAGRVMEYMWQYIFTGQAEVCPSEHECLCEGYGICFEDEESLGSWYALRGKQKEIEREIFYLQYNASDSAHAVADTLRGKSEGMKTELEILKKEAFRRGEDAGIT
jgi:hypothetical protein